MCIKNSLCERSKLLFEASLFEEKAIKLRNMATTNNLLEDINVIQNEVLSILDRINLLRSYVLLACKLFGSEISLDTYQNFSFQDRSIEALENELIDLTRRVISLMDLLEQVCGYVGHDFKLVKKDSILDFSGLETVFEEKQICYCSICGDALYLDLDEKVSFDSSLIERLEKLRIARKMQVYESKFKILDNLQR